MDSIFETIVLLFLPNCLYLLDFDLNFIFKYETAHTSIMARCNAKSAKILDFGIVYSQSLKFNLKL